MKRLAAFAAGALALLFQTQVPNSPAALDTFEDVSRWRAAPSSGVSLALSRAEGVHGAGMRLDFDFQGHAGWAAARREIPTELPGNWEISFAVKGAAAANDLEFKLVDASGENVWWSVRRDWSPPGAWTTVRLKKRHFSFAWGPSADRDLRRFAAIEIAITARAGGRGWIELDDLTLTPLPPPGPPAHAPVVTASASDEGSGASRAMDGDAASAWRTGASPAWLAIDFGERREYGGLTVRWEPGRAARRYAVETSDDGAVWSGVRDVEEGGGTRADLYLPESESRFVRLRLLQPEGTRGFGVREIVVQPLAYSESANAFLEAVARESPRGAYPRSFTGEQEYWTVAGVSGDSDCALLSEDGAVEPSRGAFSVAPFLFAEGRLFSWTDVRTEHALERGDLPVPRVRWKGLPGAPGAAPGFPLDLEITALASGAPGASAVEARYRVTNPGKRRLSARLFLAIRPLQVNPPQQFLNGPGGASPIHSLAWDGRAVFVDGAARVFPSDGPRPAGFGAMAFESGSLTEALGAGKLPPRASVRDGLGFASGALAWDLDLAGGASEEVVVALPIHGGAPVPPAGDGAFRRRLAAAREAWGAQVDRVRLTGPSEADAEAEDLLRSVRTNLADILVERDGPALRPGTRAYARSWIRDGAMMSAALLRLGHEDEARRFIAWFAKFQEPGGRVPCCVDRRGADPVVENDSHGELIFAIAEYFRFTKDRAFLDSMFSHVEGAVSWIERERQRRRTDVYRAPDKVAFFGLLPESISHEGYSAKPVHSYWDDFWALKGLKDAVELAGAFGREDLRVRWAAIRDEFAVDLYASIARVSRDRGLDTLPASADLADFDPTSTTISLDPAGEQARLPEPALHRTFEKYFSDFLAREKSADWDAYTPYEVRNVGALLRLGWRDRAHELLRFFRAGRRPPEWNAWAEVVGREPRRPRFVGDIPHAWVGSDFIRAVLDLYAWERESDGALVIASGIPASWLDGGHSVGVEHLRTPHGRLTWSMRREKENRLRVTIAAGVAVPPGGIAIQPPLPEGTWNATVNGRKIAFAGEELVVRSLPADVTFERRTSAEDRR